MRLTLKPHSLILYLTHPPSHFNHHNCRANTKTFKYPGDQRLEVRAQEAISRGQEISTQYVTSMKATFARRPVLRAKWYFSCR